jgi:hypothetical protein
MRPFNRVSRALVPTPQRAAADVAVGLPELGAGIPSALEQLLSKGRVHATLAMLGPAFVASIAYVDPGNFATNFQGGAQFGYLLLWVVLAANIIAMLIRSCRPSWESRLAATSPRTSVRDIPAC